MESTSSSRRGGKVEEEEGGGGERPHVLAVDDSLVDRKLIERLLTNSSCKVTTAENGQRALELLGHNNKSLKINLIITDYCMPGMTGYELLKKVKESSYLKEIPVVVVSSENVPTRVKMCLEEGAQEFILKPLKPADVQKLRCHMQFSQHCNGRLCMGR